MGILPSPRGMLRGSTLVLVSRVVGQAFKLAGLLFLARQLAPADLGVFGVALIVIAAVTTFTDLGFDAALVQRSDRIDEYLDVAFTWNLIRALVLSVAVWFVAPAIASFFREPFAAPLIRCMIPVLVLEGLVNPASVEVRRNLLFRRIAAWDLAEALTTFAAAVILAVMLRDVWAIPLSLIAGQGARTAMSYAIRPYRPRWRPATGPAAALLTFGRWVLLTNVVTFLLLYIDDTVVGRVAGLAALGLYQVAFRIACLPATELGNVAAKLSFPAFSSVQFDDATLSRQWLSGIRLVALLALPLSCALVVAASELVNAILGAEWAGLVPLVQILAVFGAIRPLNAVAAALLYARGAPDRVARISSFQLLLVGVTVVPAVRLAGAVGAAMIVTIANGLTLAVLLHSTRRELHVDVRRVVDAVLPAVGIAAATAVCIAGTLAVLPDVWAPAVRLLFAAAFALALIVIIVVVSRRRATPPFTLDLAP